MYQCMVLKFETESLKYMLFPDISTSGYASVNSSGAHAPLRANPRALAFFLKNGQIPRSGDT